MDYSKIKVGDKLLIETSHNGKAIDTVQRFTKKYIVCIKRRFKKSNGASPGEAWYRDFIIKVATQEDIQFVKDEIEKKERYSRIYEFVTSSSADCFTLEQVKKITAIIDEAKANKK